MDYERELEHRDVIHLGEVSKLRAAVSEAQSSEEIARGEVSQLAAALEAMQHQAGRLERDIQAGRALSRGRSRPPPAPTPTQQPSLLPPPTQGVSWSGGGIPGPTSPEARELERLRSMRQREALSSLERHMEEAKAGEALGYPPSLPRAAPPPQSLFAASPLYGRSEITTTAGLSGSVERGAVSGGGVRPPPWEARPGASRDVMAARLSSELEAKTRMASLEAELNMMRSHDATPPRAGELERLRANVANMEGQMLAKSRRGSVDSSSFRSGMG